jgi:hypothetical protein
MTTTTRGQYLIRHRQEGMNDEKGAQQIWEDFLKTNEHWRQTHDFNDRMSQICDNNNNSSSNNNNFYNSNNFYRRRAITE